MTLDEKLGNGNVVVVDRSFLAALERQFKWALRTYELIASRNSHIIVPSRIFFEHYQPTNPSLSDILDMPYSITTLQPSFDDSESIKAHLQKKFYFNPKEKMKRELSPADISLIYAALKILEINPNVGLASGDKDVVSSAAYASDEKEFNLEIYSPWTIHNHEFFADKSPLALLANSRILPRLMHSDFSKGIQYLAVAPIENPYARSIAFDVHADSSGNLPEIDGVNFIPVLGHSRVNGMSRVNGYNSSDIIDNVVIYGGKSHYDLKLISRVTLDDIKKWIVGDLQERQIKVPFARDWHLKALGLDLSRLTNLSLILSHDRTFRGLYPLVSQEY